VGAAEPRVRLLVYTDYVYRRDETGAVYAERAFALFMARLRDHVERLVIAGRLEPAPGRWHYRLPDDVEFVALPHYEALSEPGRALPAMVRSLRRFWRALREVDAAWVLGPYPLSYALVLLAAARGRRVVLGVRQDWPRYVASRHPDRRGLVLAANAMEAAWRVLARLWPVIVVGPDLADRYGGSRGVLPVSVSMVDEADLVSEEQAGARSYEGQVRVLSVGRLDAEKNPLLLADVLARLDDRFRLVVCGQGPLEEALAERLRARGLDGRAELRGYVPIDGGLLELYRESELFLHVSLTEGLPQVLFEAFAAGLPVVATAVGGVPAAAGGAAVLVEPNDPDAAARELERLASDADARAKLVQAGLERARRHTTEAECRRIAGFIAGSPPTRSASS
jgi:glycosyltransferase involved in cell wall biosynthesis